MKEIKTYHERCPFCGKWHIQSMHLNIICPCGAKYYIHTGEWLDRKGGLTHDSAKGT